MPCVDATDKNRFLAYGEQLHSRFVVLERIGSGGFGQIFKATDVLRNASVAIKVEDVFGEQSEHDPRRLVIERKVLAEVRGQRHFPLVFASGNSEKGRPFIVMELLGPNLAALRKRLPSQCFSHLTLFRVAQQVVIALEVLHKLQYIHRDIKPTNCCIGASGVARKTIYLIDFSMCRKMLNRKDQWIAPRTDAGFCGTIRYASARAMRRKECGAVDDLVSWMYAVVEMGTGQLPWKREDKMDTILRMKREIKSDDLCKELPAPMTECLDYLRSLHYDDAVKYDRIQELLRRSLPRGFSYDDPYDWETGGTNRANEVNRMKKPKAKVKKRQAPVEQAKKSGSTLRLATAEDDSV
ncbi:hypothetical protein QR680_005004 [Steinernema hermaphroditum]|uniref:non-specific serine/threonine protein kinase n=1 Tax=Steinernema hermaphroditum TaxID=289476 RepID=A0AA39HST7_9BILA|nr:hypothetical protein QR680_005004 [Steinernema hermaphroditum]